MNAEWIDALDRDKWPPRLKRVLGFGRFNKTPVVCYQDHGEWFSNDHVNQYSITHWMPLPKPPNPERSDTSLSKWFDSLPDSDDGLAKIIGEDGFEIYWEEAKVIWDAAIAASKQPDFVE